MGSHVTAIWCDWGDNDTALLQRLWQGISNIDVIHITQWNDVMETCVNLALEKEDDTLLFCGHGTTYGLLAPNTYGDYVIHEANACNIHAKNVIGVMCWGVEFAERVGLHGLFTSMFISNMNECVDFCVESNQSEIDETNKVLLDVTSDVVSHKTTMEDCVSILHGHVNKNGIASFNVAGIRII